ncbi:MAG: S9 family peptidase [Actinobacteria bacterium]|nr:S9 family peptidase [Actinomycetota bacterium]
MSERVIAPYGSWSSPLTADVVARAGVRLTMASLENGVARWLEGRADEGGRVVLVQAALRESPSHVTPVDVTPIDVTPADFNLRTLVHEYGGGAYCVHDGIVFCSRFDDQRLYRIDPGREPVPITPDVEGRRHRYADGRVNPSGELWIGVRERHPEDDHPAKVINELVALPTDGSAEPRVIAGNRDFYSSPRASPDGMLLCFLAWNLPWMPWDGCELFVADLGADGTLSEVELAAGKDGEESIWQPEWSPSGDLVFVSDRSGWWNLERIRDGERAALHTMEAEFGYPAWVFGGSSYDFLDDGTMLCSYESEGRTSFAVLDPESGSLEPLDLPYDALWGTPQLVAEGSTALFLAGSATIPNHVVALDVPTRRLTVLRTSIDAPIDATYFSIPRSLEFPTENGLTAHALFYPPTNPRYDAPATERPPVIVMSHGGPTGAASSILDLQTQFWTTRGFAVVDVNYGGSTGYGREYRERLNGEWGVVDLADCVNAARHLADLGQVDPDRFLIRGGSAGGYTTICALTFTDVFSAGASYFGIADLEPTPDGHTHKFEFRYEHTLLGPYPETAEIFRARSPINFVDRLSTPMLVLQGTDDEIVPQEQAELIVAALRERGVAHAYLLFEGEGHGFRKAENIVASLEAELSFYAQVLGVEPGDAVPKLSVINL